MVRVYIFAKLCQVLSNRLYLQLPPLYLILLLLLLTVYFRLQYGLIINLSQRPQSYMFYRKTCLFTAKRILDTRRLLFMQTIICNSQQNHKNHYMHSAYIGNLIHLTLHISFLCFYKACIIQ